MVTLTNWPSEGITVGSKLTGLNLNYSAGLLSLK